MANKLTLADITAEADRRFAPVRIDLGEGDEVILQNLLRLKSDDRTKVLALIETLRDVQNSEGSTALDDIDKMAANVEDVLRLVAGKAAGKLLRALDGDFAKLLVVLEHWLEETQPGEAQNSPN